MKGGAQWYVWGTEPGIAGDVLRACEIAGLRLVNRRTGAITYLSEDPGHEGDQIATTREALATFSGSVQLWLGDIDVICTIGPVPEWQSTLFDFSFDGATALDASEIAAILRRARARSPAHLGRHARPGVAAAGGHRAAGAHRALRQEALR